jgi:PII-like signaling protein
VETHRRKRIEILVERRLVDRVLAVIEQEPRIHGYTVLPCLEGLGSSGPRQPDPLTDLLSEAMVLAICAEEPARALLERLVPLLKEIGGIAWLSDVEVVRAERF